jgi:hypothetical protein
LEERADTLLLLAAAAAAAAAAACRLDLDGSVVRHVQPAMPAQPYLIGSQPDWWRLDDISSWREPRFNNPWISPMPSDEVAARIEMRVANNGQQYTIGAFDGQDITRIGYVSQFGNVNKRVIMTRTEGTTGMTGADGGDCYAEGFGFSAD